MSPTYSFIIPCLNEEKFLPNLLESLSLQGDTNFEVIVVDGSSTDKSVEIAKSFENKVPGLHVIVSKKASLPLQRNIGARASQGKWCVFVDADTVLLPYFLERVTLFVEAGKPALFTTWFRPDSESVGDAVVTLLADIMLEGSIMFHKPLSPGPLTIVTREAYESVGGYDEEHAFHEDMDFSLRLHKNGVDLHMLRETLCILSLRRLRKEGTLTFLQHYIRAALPVLFFSRTMKHMPGYIMGGQLYGKKKQPIKRSVVKQYEGRLKKLLRELLK